MVGARLEIALEASSGWEAPAYSREPISPELVLIDRELARALRAAPSVDIPLHRGVIQPSVSLVPQPSASRPADPHCGDARHDIARRMASVVMAVGLLISGFLAAEVVSALVSEPVGSSEQAASPSVRISRATTAARLASSGSTGRKAQRPSAEVAPERNSRPARVRPRENAKQSRAAPSKVQSATDRGARTSVGRRLTGERVARNLLALVVQAPSKNLPPALLDPVTGLARNNLQATCRRAARSFACVVEEADSRGRRLRVSYRRGRDGRWSFAWREQQRG